MEVVGFRARHPSERAEHRLDARAQVLPVETVVASQHVDALFGQLARQLARLSAGQPALQMEDGVAQCHGASYLGAWHAGGVDLRVAGIEEESLHAFAGEVQVVVQHFFIQGHLQLVLFPRFANGIFFRLPALQLYQFAGVLREQVHAALQAEGFAEEGRLEFHGRLLDVDVCRAEVSLHHLADVVELRLALVEKLSVDAGQGGVGQGRVPEAVLHGAQVEFLFGRAVALLVHAVVQKLVGRVSELYGGGTCRGCELV